MSSPARPWFKVGLSDQEAEKSAEVKKWLDEVQKKIQGFMSRTNFYESLTGLYKELAIYGTSVFFILEDEEKGFRIKPVVPGSYCLAAGPTGRVDTCFRVFNYTARQLLDRFGEDKVSQNIVDNAAKGASEDTPYKVTHAVFPNTDIDEDRDDWRGKRYISIYYMFDAPTSDPQREPAEALQLGGYDELPFVAPRWDVEGDDVYGRSPGADARPDVVTLQNIWTSTLKGMHKAVDPPMNASSQMRHASIAPGAINYLDNPAMAFEPTIKVQSNPERVGPMMVDVRNSIKEALYNDLFRMLGMIPARSGVTATEIDERVEEKLIQLGPVIERLHAELHDPMVERIYAILLRAGRIPLPPESIQDIDFNIEYISLLAQAQKMIATAGIEKFLAFLSASSDLYPEIPDLLDQDQMGRHYGDSLGVPQMIIRTPRAVQAIRDSRAQANAELQERALASQNAQDAKTMSETDMGGDNALRRMTGGFAR